MMNRVQFMQILAGRYCRRLLTVDIVHFLRMDKQVLERHTRKICEMFVSIMFFRISGTSLAPGLLPRFCTDLFKELQHELNDGGATIELSYYEIYKEKV